MSSKKVSSKQVAKKSSSLDEALFSAELELDELMEKIKKYEGFLSSPSGDQQPVFCADVKSVTEQMDAMSIYASRLSERIARFKSIRECIVSVI